MLKRYLHILLIALLTLCPIIQAAQISRQHDAEISNLNVIDADDLDDEFNSLVSESNSQDTRLTDLESSAMTIAGVKTFSSTPKMNAIDERTAAAGVTVDSVLLKDGMVTVSGTPTASGMIGYASNTLKYHNGTTVISMLAEGTVNARSSNTILALGDKSSIFIYSSTFTQTLTAAATLGSGWYVDIHNDGTGVITLDPNGSETIDDQTTIPVFQGESFRIYCDGSNFKTIGRAPAGTWVLAETLSPSAVSSVDSTVGFVANYDHKYEISNLNSASDAVGFDMRVSTDGSTFLSGASDYQWTFGVENSAGAFAAAAGDLADNEISLFNTGSTEMDLGDAAGEPPHTVIVEGYNLDTSDAKKTFKVDSINTSSVGRFSRGLGSGAYIGSTSAILGVRFLSSANFSGTIKHYVRRRA